MRGPLVVAGLPAVVSGALLLLAGGAASADTIEMKNGRTLEGKVIEETDTSITIEVDGGKVTMPRSMVREVRRGGTLPGAGPAAAAASAPASPPLPAEEWSLLWAGERRVGWRRVQAKIDSGGAVFEEEAVFLGEDGIPEAELRLVEESAPDLSPRSFVYRESSKECVLQRTGRVEGGRLRVETVVKGEKKETSHPAPPGLRFPMSARAFVLREGERLPGGWKGTVYDPRSGEFVETALRTPRRERLPWEGKGVDALVLVRDRGGVKEEERVAADGRTLTAELNGPCLVAVQCPPERVASLKAGEKVEASAEEKRARSVFDAPGDGFRIGKPSVAWDFVPGRAGSTDRVTVRDVGGVAYVRVDAEPSPGGRALSELGASMETRFRAHSGDLRVLEDGFGELGGEKAFRILCDARLKGDLVRTLALTSVHGGRAWTVTASCPAHLWEAARPHLERIVASFEWL